MCNWYQSEALFPPLLPFWVSHQKGQQIHGLLQVLCVWGQCMICHPENRAACWLSVSCAERNGGCATERGLTYLLWGYWGGWYQPVPLSLQICRAALVPGGSYSSYLFLVNALLDAGKESKSLGEWRLSETWIHHPLQIIILKDISCMLTWKKFMYISMKEAHYRFVI